MCKIGLATRRIFIAAIGTFAAVLVVSKPASAQDLRIGGTGAATAMLQHVGSAFAAQEDGGYPDQPPFNFVLPAEPKPAGARPIAYLRSPEGIRALRETGIVPLQNGR